MIDIIAGARPNFVKISTIINNFKKINVKFRLIHTGQHYTKSMSDDFFKNLNIPTPFINLNVKSGSHAEQTSKIMIRYEKLLLSKKKPKYVLVVGDVNSTLACAIVAKKLNLGLMHVEAGLRSFDNQMPEEVNRIITDSIADIYFVTSLNAKNNLIKSNIKKKKTYFVGNTMIDSLKDYIKISNLKRNFNSKKVIITTHRPENLKNIDKLIKIINKISKKFFNLEFIYVLHPVIKKKLLSKNLYISNTIKLIDALPYDEFLRLILESKMVITDSGGLSEETTYLNIPCLTLRYNTERPETVDLGSNTLVGRSEKLIIKNIKNIINNTYKSSKKIPKWDGKTGKRIAKICKKII